MQAFELVARDRAMGMSPGPVPMTSMFNYIDRFTLIGSTEEFIAVISKMDDVYLKYSSDERKKQQQRASQAKPGIRR